MYGFDVDSTEDVMGELAPSSSKRRLSTASHFSITSDGLLGFVEDGAEEGLVKKSAGLRRQSNSTTLTGMPVVVR